MTKKQTEVRELISLLSTTIAFVEVGIETNTVPAIKTSFSEINTLLGKLLNANNVLFNRAFILINTVRLNNSSDGMIELKLIRNTIRGLLDILVLLVSEDIEEETQDCDKIK